MSDSECGDQEDAVYYAEQIVEILGETEKLIIAHLMVLLTQGQFLDG